MAVTVTFDVPAEADPAAVNVPRNRVEPLNAVYAAVTPVGSPVVDITTFDGVPVIGVMVMAVAPWSPWTTLKLTGARAIEKFTVGGAVTVTVTVTVGARLPDVPFTVNCVALSEAELAAVRVSTLVPVVLAGLNDAVTPVGKPVAVKATVPPKPPTGLTVRVAVPGLPTDTFTLETDDPSVKLAGAVTDRLMFAVADTAPDLAVTVKVGVEIVAEALAVSVRMLVEEVLAGLKLAVTPDGNPATVSATAPVKPLTGVAVMVLATELPWLKLRLAGAAARVTPGVPLTVKAMATEVAAAFWVPVSVTLAALAVAEGAAVNVTVLVVAVVAGLNVAVTPLGRPVADKVTFPLKPLFGVMVRVSVALAPCTTLTVAAEACIVKAGGAVTVRVIAAVAFRLPEVPVTVTVVAPNAALALAVKVNVLAVAVLDGLNPAVTPLGKPAMARFTAPLNPLAGRMAILAVPPAPWITLTAVGVACTVKLDAAVTCNVSTELEVRLPETPCAEIV